MGLHAYTVMGASSEILPQSSHAGWDAILIVILGDSRDARIEVWKVEFLEWSKGEIRVKCANKAISEQMGVLVCVEVGTFVFVFVFLRGFSRLARAAALAGRRGRTVARFL